MALRVIKTNDPLRDPDVRAVRDRLRAGAVVARDVAQVDVVAAVKEVIEGVRHVGDRYVVIHTEKMHGARLTPETLRVPAEEMASAHETYERDDPGFLTLVRKVAANIREYQESILVEAPPPLKRGGRTMSVRYSPIARVCVYVPAGKAVYASTVLMTVVPAQVAGVAEIVIVTPPGPDGSVHPMVLALAAELDVDEVYGVSGVAGLAAAAIGTDRIPRVDKIVGPGSAFIAEAKRQVYGQVDIDSIAGPSEVLIVADDSARPNWVAADMLAQAEHEPGSAVLVTPSASLADAVVAEIERQLTDLKEQKRDAINHALESYSAIIVVDDLEVACAVADDFATEHLQIMTADEEATLEMIHNAGAIFVGPQTPVPLGDYYAGPSHVLPTGGAARFSGPLSCNDFLKATSIIRYDADSLAEDAADVIDFATREGLTAHANAIRIRKNES